jgi:HSP20 family protein
MSTIMTRPLWSDLMASWPFEEWTKSRPEMLLETYLEDGTLVVKAEIPGIDPDKDVEVEVHDDVLTIKATREESTREELPEGYRSEFRYGSFARRILLPEGAVTDDVKATYTDGVLEIRVPVNKEAKVPAKVPITRL